MKLLFSGDTFCDQPIFKRLLVIAEELYFMDRPSVTFGNWGTVGHDSYARRLNSSGSPVLIGAIAPPSGPAKHLYSPYIESDINNPEFKATVLKGFQLSDAFASKFIQFEGNYGSGKGHEIVRALRADGNLLNRDMSFPVDGPDMLFSTDEQRIRTFKVILYKASIAVTSTLLSSEEASLIPVTEDPYIAQLIALRTSSSSYIGGTSKLAPYIGMELATTVLPDQLLAQLPISKILEYREKTKDAYIAWSAELNRAAASIDKIDGANAREEIAKVIAEDLNPKIIEYKAEMSAIRDNLFANQIKSIAKWEVPTLSIAYMSGITNAVAWFACALTPAIPALVDYYKDRRNAERKNAMSFLIGLSKKFQ